MPLKEIQRGALTCSLEVLYNIYIYVIAPKGRLFGCLELKKKKSKRKQGTNVVE